MTVQPTKPEGHMMRDECKVRLGILEESLAKVQETSVNIAVMKNDISHMKEGIEHLTALLKSTYITKSEFEPIKNIVYGTAGLILTAVVIALISMVVKNGH